jgi:hypothetical protein
MPQTPCGSHRRLHHAGHAAGGGADSAAEEAYGATDKCERAPLAPALCCIRARSCVLRLLRRLNLLLGAHRRRPELPEHAELPTGGLWSESDSAVQCVVQTNVTEAPRYT